MDETPQQRSKQSCLSDGVVQRQHWRKGMMTRSATLGPPAPPRLCKRGKPLLREPSAATCKGAVWGGLVKSRSWCDSRAEEKAKTQRVAVTRRPFSAPSPPARLRRFQWFSGSTVQVASMCPQVPATVATPGPHVPTNTKPSQ